MDNRISSIPKKGVIANQMFENFQDGYQVSRSHSSFDKDSDMENEDEGENSPPSNKNLQQTLQNAVHQTFQPPSENYEVDTTTPHLPKLKIKKKLQSVQVTNIYSCSAFDHAMLIIILMNSLSLAMYNYADRDSLTEKNQILDQIGTVFTIIFIIECIMKILAFGFVIHKQSYLRLGWNIIDFIVAVSGFFELVLNSAALRAFRVIRVIRPLKSVNFIKSLRKLVEALIQAMPRFLHVALFLFFVFILISIIGVSQYSGLLYGRCRYKPQPETPTFWNATSDMKVCASNTSDNGYQCPEGLYCGFPIEFGISLLDDGVYDNEQINYGITTFDDIRSAILTVFQITTLEAWNKIMFNLINANFYWLAAIFCLIIVILGDFFLFNLILAVIISAFIKIKKEQKVVELNDLEEKEKTLKQEFDLKTKTKSKILNVFSQNAFKNKIVDSFQNKIEQITNCEIEQPNRKNEEDVQEQIINKSFQEIEDEIIQKLNFLRPYIIQREFISQVQKLRENTKRKSRILKKAILPEISSTRNLQAIMMDQQTENKAQSDVESQSSYFDNSDTNMLADIEKTQNKEIQTKLIQFKKRAKTFAGNINNNFNGCIKLHPIQEDHNDHEFQSEQMSSSSSNKSSVSCGSDSESGKENEKQEKEGGIINERKETEKGKAGKSKTVGPEQIFRKSTSIQKKRVVEEIAQISKKLKQKTRRMSTLRFVGKKAKYSLEDVEIRNSHNKCYFFAHKVIKNYFFHTLITGVILANVVLLCLDQYPPDEQQQQLLDYINFGFTALFLIEMILKLVALGFKGFMIQRHNLFDAFIVLASLVDVFITIFLDSITSQWINKIRLLRVLRIFRLAESWERLHKLFLTLWRTLIDVSTFSILLFIIVYIYTLLGMELFANNVKFNDDNRVDLVNGTSPDSNFDTFLNGITTVFIILTNDQWSEIFFTFYRTVGGGWATFFFISLIIVGQKIMLNLFLAILLQNFDEAAIGEKLTNEEKDEELDEVDEVQVVNEAKKYWIELYNKIQTKFNECLIKMKCIKKEDNDNTKTADKHQDNYETVGTSLFLFTKDHKFRIFLSKMVHFKFETGPKLFDMFIILVVLVTMVQLGLENPLNDPNGQLVVKLNKIDIFTTSIFLFEFVVKIIVHGAYYCGPKSYFKSVWHILDFVILIFSLINLSPLINGYSFLKIFRVLRPLKIISKNEGLQLAFLAMMYAIPNIINVALVIFSFLIIFAILTVNFFKGKFYYCDSDMTSFVNDFTIYDKWDCLNGGSNWIRNDVHFDNIKGALMAVFQVATGIGWVDILYFAISTTEIDQAPIPDHNRYLSIAFIFYMIVCNFFLLNLFMGVIVSQFNIQQSNLGGINLLTPYQKEYIESKILILKSSPVEQYRESENYISSFCFRLQDKKWFDPIVMCVIILNSIVLCIKYYGIPHSVDQAGDYANIVFSAIFTLEALIKIIGLGKAYFQHKWNIFDIIVVVGSNISIVLTELNTVNINGAANILRLFKLARMMRLFNKSKSIKLILNTFIVTLPSIINLGSLLLLWVYLYAVIGTQLFATVTINGVFTENLNFQSFANSFLTMFVAVTGDSWDQIFSSSVKEYAIDFQCIDSPSYQDYVNNGYQTIGCGAGPGGYFFFYSFFFVVVLVFLNLFLAIIINGFEQTQTLDEKEFNQATLKDFKMKWSILDPGADAFISTFQLTQFLQSLDQNIGWDLTWKEDPNWKIKIIVELNLPLYHGGAHLYYFDVLDALMVRSMVNQHMKEQIEKEEKQQNVDSPSHKDIKLIQQQQRKTMTTELGKLFSMQENENIVSYHQAHELQNRRVSRVQTQLFGKFTSIHFAAAEIVVEQMRKYVELAKENERKELQIYGPNFERYQSDEIEIVNVFKKEKESKILKRIKKPAKNNLNDMENRMSYQTKYNIHRRNISNQSSGRRLTEDQTEEGNEEQKQDRPQYNFGNNNSNRHHRILKQTKSVEMRVYYEETNIIDEYTNA